MISEKIASQISGSSWIRAMFEEGTKLRRLYGDDNVFDFSLGNPDLEPPKGTKDALKNIVLNESAGLHKYMSNAGHLDVRERIAKQIEYESGVKISDKHVIMTCGAAGGLNVVLKTILNPGEEIIVLAPYFVEYLSYIDNYGGKAVISPCKTESFEPDMEDLDKKINPKTKGIIINSPNNPSGAVYSKKTLEKIAELIEHKQKKYGTKILIISDEPYNRLVYDDVKVPSILKIFKNSVVVNSYSKSLALPGERIGYIAISSLIDNADSFVDGLVYSNRILGFVNAPSLFQKVIAQSLDEKVEISIYQRRRDILYNHLTSLGFECAKPQGAFYLFPKSPIEDDIQFVRHAVKYNILLVPGTGFGFPGYFRLAYCVSENTIENSLPAFEALAKDFK